MTALKSKLLFWLVPFWPSLFNYNRRHRIFLSRYAKLTIKQHLGWWVQVGANDGGDWDPFAVSIRHSQLNALLIEPVEYLFERLKKNYQAYKGYLILEKLAIAAQEGSLTIKGIDPGKQQDLPGWAAQISSLREEVILRHDSMIPGIENRLFSEEVTVKPLSAVLQQHGIKKIAMLQVDTEGFDAVVLGTIDFSKVSIGLMWYEHKHLLKEEQEATLALLQNNGFCFHQMKGDTIAWSQWNITLGKMVKKYLVKV